MKHFVSFVAFLGAWVWIIGQNQPDSYRSDLWFVKFEPWVGAALPDDRRALSATEFRQLGVEPIAHLLEAHPEAVLRRAFPLRSADIDRIYRIEFASKQPANAMAQCEALQAHPAVTYAELAPIYHADFIPNDYSPSALRHLAVIGAPDAWDLSKGDSNIVVAVVDAALLTSHPDLAANIWINRNEDPTNGIDDDGNGYIDDWRGWDAANTDNDPNPPNGGAFFFNHGTLVAGCVAAVTDNGTGIAGIGFNTRIMAVKTKIDGSTGTGLTATFDGMAYAVAAGADVINMSFGGPGSSGVVQDLINEGHSRGIIFVSSSGNTGQNEGLFPSAYNHVISVGSTNFNDRVSGFSTIHSSVDIMAPGNGIRTTSHQTNRVPSYTVTQGTSFSCPIVAGTIGLMLARDRCSSPDSIEAILKRTAVNIDSLNPNDVGLIGAGRVDAAAAVAAMSTPSAPIASFSYDSTVSCTGEVPFEVLIPAGCPNGVQWEVDGQSSTLFSPTFTFSTSGVYPVSLIVNNSLGADTLMRNVNITVGRVPSVDAGGGPTMIDTFCIGDQLQLNATTDATGNFSVRWSPQTGILSGINSLTPIISPFQSTQYSVAVTGEDGCVGISEIFINATPKPLLSPPQTIRMFAGTIAQPQVTSNNPNLSYNWSPTSFLSDSTVANPVISPDSSLGDTTIVYNVMGTDPSGCFGTTTITVDIQADTTSRDTMPPANIERAFARAGGSLLAPVPQPADAEVTFRARFDKAGELALELFDLRGQRVARIYEGAASQDYRLRWRRPEGLSPGVYLLRWTYRGSSVYQRLSLR